jgi:hypothetical protein
LIAYLAVAWRIEWLGGILFIVVGLSPFVLLSNPKWVNLMLGGPFMLAGLLFLASHYLHVREKAEAVRHDRHIQNRACPDYRARAGRVVSRLDPQRSNAARPDRLGAQRDGRLGDRAAVRPRQAVDEMTQLLWQGPPHADVTGVKLEDIELAEPYADFRIGA